MSAVIQVSGLRYRYDDGTLALDGVDFALNAGETVALLGPNGSGKTTFALHLNGLLRGEGTVSICGSVLEARNLAEIRRRVGMVFQDPDEQLFMPTVLEDVMFGPLNAGASPAEARRRAVEALERAGIAGAISKAPYHLSAGEKRRVAIAGVLATRPDILVLDEPTTYLDPPGQRELIRTLIEFPEAKLIITHDAGFARALTRRAVFFQNGRIAADGNIDEIIRRFVWSTES